MKTEKQSAAETDDANGVLLDQFDPAALRLDQDYAATIGVKKHLTTVHVRKPNKTEFVMVNSAEDFQIVTAVLELREDREIYLVAPGLRTDLSTESTFGIREIVTAISRQGVLFLWPLTLPAPDGKVNAWHQSAIEAAKLAKTRWVRVQANMAAGNYDVSYAAGELPEPVWPEYTFHQILKVAFRDRFIDSMDHPVLRRLRGEI